MGGRTPFVSRSQTGICAETQKQSMAFAVWMITDGCPKDDYTWLSTPGVDGREKGTEASAGPKMYVGEFAVDPEIPDETAHMQMHGNLPLRGPNETKGAVICAGSIKDGRLHWNSLYNSAEFREFMNKDQIWHGPDDYETSQLGQLRRIRHMNGERKRQKDKTPDTPCSEAHKELAQQLYDEKQFKYTETSKTR